MLLLEVLVNCPVTQSWEALMVSLGPSLTVSLGVLLRGGLGGELGDQPGFHLLLLAKMHPTVARFHLQAQCGRLLVEHSQIYSH